MDTAYPRINGCIIQGSELFPTSLTAQQWSLYAENTEHSVAKTNSKIKSLSLQFLGNFCICEGLSKGVVGPCRKVTYFSS